MTHHEDVKGLLGRAFGEEPPLRIDRDEVVRQGRKRLRRRRILEAGSVVAAVVLAAVGAATLTRIADTEPSRLPPAASSQQEAPPEPTATEVPAVKFPEVEPDRLTALLHEFGIVGANGVRGTQLDSGEPGARVDGDRYVYEADVIRPSTQGQVRITITTRPGKVKGCEALPEPYFNCEQRTSARVPVIFGRYEGADGQRRSYATAVLDNGLHVEVTASNQTSRATEAPPAGAEPVLTDEEICALAVKAGLGV
ncbi:MAG TPA: hypothetical protein VGV34_04825 [Solirubrobacterales bacterium]|nr:hypothetical protein [Solirubrobacterales bacterium]